MVLRVYINLGVFVFRRFTAPGFEKYVAALMCCYQRCLAKLQRFRVDLSRGQGVGWLDAPVSKNSPSLEILFLSILLRTTHYYTF